MTDKLLPCPFCGGEAHTHNFSWHASQFAGHLFANPYWQVQCSECRAVIGDFNTRSEAIEAWNTRAERTCRADKHDGYGYRFECSACGYSSITHNCETRLDELPNYCPNCGAKVVGGDGVE